MMYPGVNCTAPIARILLAFCLAGSVWAKQPHEVTVVSHGWHTGLIVARDDLPSDMAPLFEHLEEAPWIEFGWGDRSYYQRGEGRPWLLIPAAMWPTETVMHVVGVPEPPTLYFPESEQETISISADAWPDLMAALIAGFAHESPRQAEYLGTGLYGDSAFFTGQGRFHLRRTCNTWTLEILAAAGLDVQPEGTIRARGVMRQVRDL